MGDIAHLEQADIGNDAKALFDERQASRDEIAGDETPSGGPRAPHEDVLIKPRATYRFSGEEVETGRNQKTSRGRLESNFQKSRAGSDPSERRHRRHGNGDQENQLANGSDSRRGEDQGQRNGAQN